MRTREKPFTELENQAAINTIRALIGDRAGFREKRIMDAPLARVRAWDSNPKGRNCVQVVDPKPDGYTDSTFVVDLDTGEIVN